MFLFLLLLSLPTQLGFHFWPSFTYLFGLRLDYLSPVIYLTDCLLIVHSLWLTISHKFSLSKKSLILLTVLSAYIILTSQYSYTLGIYKTFVILKCLYLAYLTRVYISSRQLVLSLTMTSLFLSLLAITQTHLGSNIGHGLYWLGERQFDISSPGIAKTSHWGIHYLRPYATFSHPNSLAGFLLVSIIVVLALQEELAVFLRRFPYAYNQGQSRRIWYGLQLSLESMSKVKSEISAAALKFLTFALAFLTIILTDSLAVICTIFIITFLLFLHHFLPEFTKKLTLITFATVLAIVPLFLLLTSNYQFSSSEDFTLRQEGYRASLTFIKMFPLTGTGLGQSLPLSLTNKLLLPSPRHAQPIHNIVLLLVTDLGIPLSFFLLYRFFHLFKKALRQNFPLSVTLLVILLTGSFDHYWLTLPQNQLLFALIIGKSLKQANM